MPASPGRITYHSPLACPACGARFQGEWTSSTDSQNQACPCGHAWLEAWAGWSFSAERDGSRNLPLHDADSLSRSHYPEPLAS